MVVVVVLLIVVVVVVVVVVAGDLVGAGEVIDTFVEVSTVDI